MIDNSDFWWTAEFSAAVSEGNAWAEERLMTLALMSGALGSELAEGEKTLLRAHYSGSVGRDELLKRLNGMLPSFEGVALERLYETKNQDWSTQHLDAFPPMEVGKSLLVMAPWHRDKASDDGRIPVYIYPATAFGTGYHESTRIALMMLEDIVRGGETIIDVGTGTGILFIAALKLGASRAAARDLDPTTLNEVRRNMELNGIDQSSCDLAVGDLLKGVSGRYDILTSNILLEPNTTLLPDVRGVLAAGGHAVFSGMIDKERGTFLKALAPQGLAIQREIYINNWWGCLARAQ